MIAPTREEVLAAYREARAAWPAKTLGTVEKPAPILSGFCSPGHDAPSHARCPVTLHPSPTHGALACCCPCHTAPTEVCELCRKPWEDHRFQRVEANTHVVRCP